MGLDHKNSMANPRKIFGWIKKKSFSIVTNNVASCILLLVYTIARYEFFYMSRYQL